MTMPDDALAFAMHRCLWHVELSFLERGKYSVRLQIRIDSTLLSDVAKENAYNAVLRAFGFYERKCRLESIEFRRS